MRTDTELLQAFVKSRDEAAFRELVQRHANLVYSSAVRQIGHTRCLSEDVTQAVFMMLAQKASRIDARYLAGWLVKAARLSAMQALRNERRRKSREEKAAAMKEETQPQDTDNALWTQVAPMVDEVLARLGKKDRSAVSLRYLEGKSIREVATAMGTSEPAAAKRISRALQKLRSELAGTGILMETTALAALLLKHGQIECPSALATTVASGALTDGAAVTSASATIAAGALTALHAKVIWSGVAAAILLFTFVIGAAVKLGAVPESDKIKVGVIISQATVTGPSAFDNRGFFHGFPRVTDLLKNEPSIELWAVIEPGTDDEDRIPAIVKSTFGGRKVHGDNVEELAKLNAVIAPHIPHTTPEVMQALRTAVRDRGVGLLNWMSLGGSTPGSMDEDTLALAGLESMEWSMTPAPVDCEVVADHPILGKYQPNATRGPQITANGPHGTLVKDATPLIKLKNPAGVVHDGDEYYPVYIANLGKGRIVCWSFAIYRPVPLDGKAFMLRSLRWLAQK